MPVTPFFFLPKISVPLARDCIAESLKHLSGLRVFSSVVWYPPPPQDTARIVMWRLAQDLEALGLSLISLSLHESDHIVCRLNVDSNASKAASWRCVISPRLISPATQALRAANDANARGQGGFGVVTPRSCSDFTSPNAFVPTYLRDQLNLSAGCCLPSVLFVRWSLMRLADYNLQPSPRNSSLHPLVADAAEAQDSLVPEDEVFAVFPPRSKSTRHRIRILRCAVSLGSRGATCARVPAVFPRAEGRRGYTWTGLPGVAFEAPNPPLSRGRSSSKPHTSTPRGRRDPKGHRMQAAWVTSLSDNARVVKLSTTRRGKVTANDMYRVLPPTTRIIVALVHIPGGHEEGDQERPMLPWSPIVWTFLQAHRLRRFSKHGHTHHCREGSHPDTCSSGMHERLSGIS
ncbi:hypothetical protein FB451DRAFT_1373252, partial [Mycena latifolia]